MVIVQARPRRKHSGGRYRTKILKRKYQLGRKPTHTKLGENEIKYIRTKGGGSKIKVLHCKTANVASNGKTKKVDIKAVIENPANRHFVRSNVIIRGTVIDTELGKAKVTSRPGQDGSVEAVLIS